jgi:hypothetical protein
MLAYVFDPVGVVPWGGRSEWNGPFRAKYLAMNLVPGPLARADRNRPFRPQTPVGETGERVAVAHRVANILQMLTPTRTCHA